MAEQVDWTRTKDLFRGLNFPATDIPVQARELCKPFNLLSAFIGQPTDISHNCDR